MNKIQTIMWLFILLIIIFSMDMMFGNPLRETFKGINKPVGSELNYSYTPDSKNINPGFLASIPPSYIIKSDDQPLHFSFPF